MNRNLVGMTQSFSGTNVIVIGDPMLDRYWGGDIRRVSSEAPVPIIGLARRDESAGGAANTAMNVAALGANVRFLSAVGDDDAGRRVLELMAEHGVGTEDVLVVQGRRTLTKTRVLAGKQMLVRLDEGSTDSLPVISEAELETRLCDAFSWADAIIISDYAYGVVNPFLLRRLTQLRAERKLPLVIDGKDLKLYRGLHPTAIKPNYEEVVSLLGAPPTTLSKRGDLISLFGDQILQLTDAEIAAVTLDRDGALIFERDRPPYQTYPRRTSEASVAGAGDTFVAALTLALTAGADSAAAAEIASCAATLVVGKDGTSVCALDELCDALGAGSSVIDDLARLRQRVAHLRQEGRRIVFTNGCFDIIHRGHVSYLSSAKALGDVLIVGLNSDDSVRRLKGPARPINSLNDRLEIVSALSSVDYIVPFEEDTPLHLIEAIRPDVYVKGGDYTIDTLPEAPLVRELGGEIQILPYVEDRSTTDIIRRIEAMSAAK
ncbi:MAG TPA: D-glycero-beta-D-manno-heptose 1-phosphate adenylyltransferase [Dehalococcoidia bacterium]|nr:D-glycero-beta-D-manno-heptose 1-phosphate adenylyltransferase [Dehalococcoidia bacterium]